VFTDDILRNCHTTLVDSQVKVFTVAVNDVRGTMADYHLLTTWHIEAPLTEVYAAILDSLHWPQWWSSVQTVEQTAAGRANGINSVWRYSWQGRLPYRVVFEVRAKHIEKLVSIEGVTRGDLEGVGRWDFSCQDAMSIVRCEWHVRTTCWWMNLIAPVARSIFIRNHAWVMAQGGEGLARLLGAPLMKQETIDLLADSTQPLLAPRALQGRLWINAAMVLVVGLGAGVIATVAQLVLWWLTGTPLLDTLFRDVRLTAALVMGSGVLTPPLMPQWDVVLVATLIHFTLSVIYALIPAYQVGRLRTVPMLFAGALYGIAIYGVNLYGLTVFFPWFAVARNWVTLVTHLVFGIALAAGCQWFAKVGSDAQS
jgi:hypothetical protein